MLLSVAHGQPEVIYTNKVLHNHLSPGILLGDYLYAFNGEAHKETDFRCLHLPSGELKWTRQDPAFGSLICAAGQLIVLSGKGRTAGGRGLAGGIQAAGARQGAGGVCWTPPVLANGLLYVRNAKGDLRCLDLK